MPKSGCTAGDVRDLAGKGQIARKRIGSRFIEMISAHFGQRVFRVQDELPREVVRHLERFRIDIPEQRAVDRPDKGRDAEPLANPEIG